MARARIIPRLLVAVFLLFLPVSLLHRALFAGDAFLPADLLGYSAPWSAIRTSPPPVAWNVLRFDGITQFYPWRMEAARSVKTGRIPLWNPFEFAAAGGAPLLANSQSAPLYPPNSLFYVVPLTGVWYVFGLSAALHLLTAAWGMYRFLRSLRQPRAASLLGAATFTLSGPVVCWLSLPTFLDVSCWLPWLFLAIYDAHTNDDSSRRKRAVVCAGLCGGLAILAGHLQVAFYVLLAGGLYALHMGWEARRTVPKRGGFAPRWAGGTIAVLALAVLLALPQLLPTLNLSRVSARAGAGPPTMTAYSAYVGNGLPVRNLATLLIPEFFGSPNPVGQVYWNTNNYGEWALYVGVIPLILTAFALALPWRRREHDGVEPVWSGHRRFFAGLTLLSLLLAMGSLANLPFFFLVPGYSQTGNPARCLVLLAFSVAVLSALGSSALLSETIALPIRQRAALIAVAGPLLLASVGASQAAAWARDALTNVAFGDLIAPAMPGIIRAAVLVLTGAAILFIAPRLSAEGRRVAGMLLLAITAADLLSTGIGYNVTSPHGDVYPITPGIAYLQEHAQDALTAPINRSWSLGLFQKAPPRGAVLPPNALTVYGLHDIAGYDSLFPASDKAQVSDAMGGTDPSPPENGNMVFIKSVKAAVTLGARYVVLPPPPVDGAGLAVPPGLTVVYTGPDMMIYKNPAGRAFDLSVGRKYRPDAFRVGLFGGLVGLAAAAASSAALTRRRGSRR